MRPLLAISLLAAGFLHAQQASVVGVVVDQTGKPLAGVHVRLITGEFDSGIGVDTVYGAMSDKAGQFAAQDMKPGMYFVLAERTGFLQQVLRLATLALKPGQNLTDYKIVMNARAAITGHVLDEYGDPVEHITVQLEPVDSSHPEITMFGRANAATDDRGQFRLTAGPGKYYLKAQAMQNFGGGRAPEIRTDSSSAAPFTSTYYPSAANTHSASVIEVAAGDDVVGMDIRLLKASPAASRGFTVSGVVVGTPENGRANIMLHYGEEAGKLHNARGAQAGEDGKFSISGMPPGYYTAAATYSSGKTTLQSRAVEFQVESADVSSLQLTLAPPEELTGKLEIVGDPAAGESTKHTVRLEWEGWGTNFGQELPPAAEVGPDGVFHLTGVPQGKFKAVVEPMPENGYLREVALDSKAAPEQVLDFTQGVGGSRLKIIVSRNGGQISGRILDKNGEPAAGMIMVLFGTDAKHIDESNGARATNGKYSFKAIRPGKYRILAMDVAEIMSSFVGGNDDELMQQLFDAAEEVEIKDGDRISKDIPLMTKVPEKKERR